MIRLVGVILLTFSFFVPMTQADENNNQEGLRSKHYRIEKPDGAGPFPAVILVSGDFGLGLKFSKKHYDNVQKRLVELGFFTLRLNYVAARNATTFMDVPTYKVADDICIAANYLKKDNFVKKRAVNVIGWSWGGASAFRSLRQTGSRESANVAAVVAYYPHCIEARHWDSEIPVLVLGGGIDLVCPIRKCNAIFDRLGQPDKLTVRVFDGARHGFDVPELKDATITEYGIMAYDETAAKAAWNEVVKFLIK